MHDPAHVAPVSAGGPTLGGESRDRDPHAATAARRAWHRGARWRWPLLCVAAALGLALFILDRFGWQPWSAMLVGVLLLCPLTIVWGFVQSLRAAPHVVGPGPETRGITIDWLAPLYDPLCRAMGAGKVMRRRTLALAELKPGDRVLDVGCGTGVLTRLAAEAVGPGGTAVGIDPGPEMIGIARFEAVRARSRAAFALGVIERLAFADGAFDVVLSSYMLHHLPAEVKRAGLGEARRVLRPGGRLVVVDFDTARPFARAMFAIFGLLPRFAPVLRQAGDPLPLLSEAGFVEAAVAGGWLGMATFWVARTPAAAPTSTPRPPATPR